MKILVIEDDPAISDMLRMGLRSDTHAVDVADNGTEGSFLARSYEYDAIILDHALPGKSGLTITKDLRCSGKTTPIIFLSVTGDAGTKVEALDSGADDYMTKPFSMAELHSRIRAVTRRAPAAINVPLLRIHDLTLDPKTHTATRAGRLIHLTKKEFALLEYMMQNQGIILSRTMLMEHVWTADSDPFSNTVETHIRNIRKKISINGKCDLIVNVTGHGYIMDIPDRLARFND